MAYLASYKIEVFPATRRTFNTTNSRLFTEHAITGLIRNLVDGNGFVATPLKTNYSGTDPFIFNIYGYYFSTLLGYITDLNYTDIYASITIEPGDDDTYTELKGIDNGATIPLSEYTGVNFTNSPQTGNNVYSLHILHRNSNGKYEVPQDSLSKFSLDSIDISLIDGGEI